MIEKINKLGKIVSTNPLPIVKNDNSVFENINASMFWDYNMSSEQFRGRKINK